MPSPCDSILKEDESLLEPEEVFLGEDAAFNLKKAVAPLEVMELDILVQILHR